ncbi:MAG: S-layer homology domain-containing protein, partial [Clostridia bacterium]|nr:S-layer homology domain-containing protein [Clostridia bacterium]
YLLWDICYTLLNVPYGALSSAITGDAVERTQLSTWRSIGSGGGGGGSSSSGKGGKVSYSFSDVAPVMPDVPSASSYVFNDIATVVWAHEAITVLHEKGIISGRGDGSFAPDAPVTREEFVKMLVAALGFETSEDAADFSDVTGNEWFAPYVYSAYKNGIVSGMGDGFGVGLNISRQDMAVMCANALNVKGAELKAVKEGNGFTDEISDYAKAAVEKLYNAGLINGLSDTEFGAKGTTTRAQAAKLLYEVTKAIS